MEGESKEETDKLVGTHEGLQDSSSKAQNLSVGAKRRSQRRKDGGGDSIACPPSRLPVREVIIKKMAMHRDLLSVVSEVIVVVFQSLLFSVFEYREESPRKTITSGCISIFY